MNVELSGLTAERFDNFGVAMPNHRYVVIGVQVALAVGIEQPDALATHDVQWLVIEQRRSLAQ
ncbi:hypothetical protein D9M70_552150 [compost metagenome]